MFFDDVASRDTLSRAVASGRIRRLAPRLYTADLHSEPAEIVVGNRWRILGRVLPGAVIADRSAAVQRSHGCLACSPAVAHSLLQARLRRRRRRIKMCREEFERHRKVLS